ncbi:MAG: polyprenyl synthetase family protein [Acidobacteriota bacterium]
MTTDATSSPPPTPFEARLFRTVVDKALREMERELIEVKSIRILADCPWKPGKRLRPITFFLAYLAERLERQDRPRLGPREIRLAASLELMHEASLVHDDLVDRSTVRRGQPTLQVDHGAAMALIVGDYMVFRALKLALDGAESMRDVRLAQQMADTGLAIAHGEVDQLQSYMERRGDPRRLTLDDYFDVIAKKTAAFFAGCAEGGAALAGADGPRRQAYRDFGMAMGMVFQMVDDLVDVMGDPDKAMKSLYSNLEEGTVTLPMIHAYTLHPEHPALGKMARGEDLDADEQAGLYALLATEGVLDRCRASLRERRREAVEALHQLPPSLFREALGDLLDFVSVGPWGGLEASLS